MTKLNQEELFKYLTNYFEEPQNKYSNDFYLNEVIKVNFVEFEEAENKFIAYHSQKGNYENYIRTAFNLAVSIDNLRDWEKFPESYTYLQIMKNISNSIKHKNLNNKKSNKYFDSIYKLTVEQITPFNAHDKRLGFILRVLCKTDSPCEIPRDFKYIATNAIKEIENYFSEKM